MTIIDQLFVTLGLDASGMTKGAKEAAAAQDKIIQDADAASQAFKKEQQAASEAFSAQTIAAVKAGKTTQDDARKSTAAFKTRQADEAYAFNKSQKAKIAAAKAERVENTRASKEKEEQAKRAAEGLGKIRNEVLALGAAYFGAKALTELNSTNAEVGRLSSTLGINTEVLSAWQGAANKFGASTEDVANAFRNVNKIQQDIDLTGNTAALQPLLRAGVDPKFFSDATDAEQKLRLLRDAFSKLTGPRAAQLGGQAGFSETFIRMLQAPKDALDQEITLQKQLNLVTKKQTEASAELDAEVGHLKEGLKGVGNEILSDLNPALLSVVKNLQEITALGKENPKVTEGVLAAGAAVGGIFAVVKVTRWLGAIRDVVKSLNEVRTAATAAQVATEAGGVIETGAAGLGIAGIARALGGVIAAGVVGYAVGTLLNKAIEWVQRKLGGEPGSHGGSLMAVDPNKIAAARGVAAAHVEPVKNPHADKATLRAEADKEMAQARRDAGIPAPAAGNQSLPRGVRNNNPGNLNFVGQEGATKESGPNGRFAVFATMQEGIAALENQLRLYAKRGIDSVRAIINKYAPASDRNNTDAYVKSVSSKLGVGENDKLNLNDPAILKKLVGSIIGVENGAKYAQLANGGVPVDRALLSGSSSAVTSNATSSNSTNTNTSEVKIGQVTVNTKATDAPGIAKDIGASLQAYAFASNANVGLQ